MTGIKQLMSNTYVVKGYITSYGVIRILQLFVPLPRGSLAHCGLGCWSQDLVKYGKGGDHSARISNGHVEVIYRDKQVVGKIPFNRFMAVESQNCIVASNGYLFSTLIGEGHVSRLEKALDQADRGEEPDFLDNSEFVRVSPDLRGQKLIKLLGGSIDRTKAVFKPDGTSVEFTKGTPLSYKRWGKTFTPPAWDSGLIDNIF